MVEYQSNWWRLSHLTNAIFEPSKIKPILDFLISHFNRDESLLRNWNPRYPKLLWFLYFANCIIKTGLLLLWKCKMLNKVFRLWCWFNSPYISTPFVLLNFFYFCNNSDFEPILVNLKTFKTFLSKKLWYLRKNVFV